MQICDRISSGFVSSPPNSIHICLSIRVFVFVLTYFRRRFAKSISSSSERTAKIKAWFVRNQSPSTAHTKANKLTSTNRFVSALRWRAISYRHWMGLVSVSFNSLCVCSPSVCQQPNWFGVGMINLHGAHELMCKCNALRERIQMWIQRLRMRCAVAVNLAAVAVALTNVPTTAYIDVIAWVCRAWVFLREIVCASVMTHMNLWMQKRKGSIWIGVERFGSVNLFFARPYAYFGSQLWIDWSAKSSSSMEMFGELFRFRMQLRFEFKWKHHFRI